MATRKRTSTDHILECNPGAGSLLRPNLVEVGPKAKSEEPDNGSCPSQVRHVGDEQPIQKDEGSGDVVLLDHGPDRDYPGNEEDETENKSNWTMATNEVSVGIPLSTATDGRTGEIHGRQDQVHEEIRLPPDD